MARQSPQGGRWLYLRFFWEAVRQNHNYKYVFGTSASILLTLLVSANMGGLFGGKDHEPLTDISTPQADVGSAATPSDSQGDDSRASRSPASLEGKAHVSNHADPMDSSYSSADENRGSLHGVPSDTPQDTHSFAQSSSAPASETYGTRGIVVASSSGSVAGAGSSSLTDSSGGTDYAPGAAPGFSQGQNSVASSGMGSGSSSVASTGNSGFASGTSTSSGSDSSALQIPGIFISSGNAFSGTSSSFSIQLAVGQVSSGGTGSGTSLVVVSTVGGLLTE